MCYLRQVVSVVVEFQLAQVEWDVEKHDGEGPDGFGNVAENSRVDRHFEAFLDIEIEADITRGLNLCQDLDHGIFQLFGGTIQLFQTYLQTKT